MKKKKLFSFRLVRSGQAWFNSSFKAPFCISVPVFHQTMHHEHVLGFLEFLKLSQPTV